MKRVLFFILLYLVFACITVKTQAFSVLVTNDDGVGAEGLSILVEEFSRNPHLEITVIAPAANQSGTGDDFTTGDPISVSAAATAAGYPATAVAAYPADTVLFGVLKQMEKMPDVVVSGVNHGQNYTDYISYSGTVGAALTAARLGIPAIAVSQGLGEDLSVASEDYRRAAVYAANLIEQLRTDWLFKLMMAPGIGRDKALVLNVNFPTCPDGAIHGIRVVPLGQFTVVTDYTLVSDDVDVQTFQAVSESLPGVPVPDCTAATADAEPETDFDAFEKGFASITPLNPDQTVNFSCLSWFGFLEHIPYAR